VKNFFADKPYPGRFIILGKDAGSAVTLYGATGRSPSSLRRRFVEQGDGVYMTAVDATVTLEGVPELLEYPAVRVFDNGIVASNGNHIEHIESLEGSKGALDILSGVLGDVTYEPDEYKTPRITGCVIEGKNGLDAALHIARSSFPDVERDYFRVPLTDGMGSYIATYAGEDIRPTPSFAGGPLSFPLGFGSAQDAAKSLYDALAPSASRGDYRIGVLAAYKKPGVEAELALINRFS
jgi:IMP cyclohydrolase